MVGYYTKFELSAYPWPDTLSDYLRRHEGEFYGVNSDGEGEDSTKWYDHEDVMRGLSSHFPDVHFTLSGEGEDSGDIWEKHFKDGLMQVCQAELTIPEYDESKLK